MIITDMMGTLFWHSKYNESHLKRATALFLYGLGNMLFYGSMMAAGAGFCFLILMTLGPLYGLLTFMLLAMIAICFIFTMR